MGNRMIPIKQTRQITKILTYSSYSRNGLTAFAVFLLSIFVKAQDKPVSCVGCRSPPVNLNFYKIQIGGKKKWHTTMERQSADGGSG